MEELHNKVHLTFNVSSSKQRPTYPSEGKQNLNIPLQEGDKLGDLNEDQHSSLRLKDLGPQVGWRTVFILEYFCPLVIHIFFFFYVHNYLWKGEIQRKSFVQTVSFVMVAFHYCKRLFESEFVHRFSHSTMPITSLMKNCFNYYVIGN